MPWRGQSLAHGGAKARRGRIALRHGQHDHAANAKTRRADYETIACCVAQSAAAARVDTPIFV